jgi:hypothetical protein
MGSRAAHTTSSTRTFQPSKPEEPQLPRKKPSIKLPKVRLKFSPWLIVAVLLAFSGFMFYEYHQAKHAIQKTAPTVNKQQVDDIVARVGKLIILPTDEKPSTLATVSNASKLKDQAFFLNAKDGDKVLVYTKHKQAILYRPSTNQLVNVSTVTVTPNSAGTSTSQ